MSPKPARAAPAERIRLVVTDIDGTLVDPHKRLTERTVAAAHRLREAGIQLCLVSSRPTRGIQPLKRALGIDTPLAGFNGGEITASDGRVVESLRMDERAARLAVEMLASHKVDVWVFADDNWFVTNPSGPYVPIERRTLGYDARVVSDFESVIGRANKILGSTIDHHLLERMETEMMTGLGGAVAAHRSQDYYLDVTHPGARKDLALKRLARLLDIPVEETAALGDMGNDVPMLEVAGLSIAMGNAPDDVQESAMEVAADNAHEGWARAIEELILPRAPRPN